MQKFLKSKTPLLIVVLLCVLFNLIFFVSVPYDKAKATLWIGYAFIMLSFLILGGVAGFFKLKSKNTMTTIWPLMCTLTGYFAVSFVLNFILMLVNSEEVKAALVLNFVVLILAAIIFVIALRSFSRVSENTEKREKRVRELRTTVIKIGSLVYLSKNDEVTKAINKLKQNASYSSSAGTPETEEYEQQLDAQIEIIRQLLNNNADKADVLQAIKEAESILKTRNQMLLATRR